MSKPLATVRGTMLTPGVSRNGRLYTRELIAKAVDRMQERLADPNGLPIVMRTHHEAGDNSALIVGRVTDVTIDDGGNANYKAALYNTGPARDIAGLVVGDKPALKSVSIHGYWIGDLKKVRHEGQSAVTADDLEIDAVDFTASPGVAGARVTQASYYSDDAPTTESANGRVAISESMEAEVMGIAEKKPKTAAKEHYVAVCVGDINGDMVKIRAENLHPDVLKKAIKKAAHLANTMIGREGSALNVPDADDMVTDAHDIDFHVITGIPSGDVMGSEVPDDSQETLKTSDAEIVSETTTSTRDVEESEESVVPDETKTEAVVLAAPNAGLSEADLAKIGALVGAAVKEAVIAIEEARATRKAAKEAKNDDEAKATETAEQTKVAVAEVKESGISASELKEQLAAVKNELRETILKESGIPSRKGFRHVAESDTDVAPTGDELWDNRGKIWDQIMPWGQSTVVPVAADSTQS